MPRVKSYKFLVLLLLLLICSTLKLQAESPENCVLCPADGLHKQRLGFVVGTTAVGYVGAFIGLNELWYKGYPRSSFRWINDGGEWLQFDKVGHAATPYQTSRLFAGTLRWAGVEQRTAAIYAGLAMFMVSNTIEVFDGFSARWGASAWDIAANFLGAGLMTGQELFWQEQRIGMKISLSMVDYPPGPLRQRARELYGTSLVQRAIKDYNSCNLWLSVNPASFGAKLGKLQWLNVAVGYSVDNVYGGYSNVWTDKNGQLQDYSHLKRTRQFFLSPDIDFTRIPTHAPFMKTFFQVLNIFKLPSPALEFNTRGELNWHWFK